MSKKKPIILLVENDLSYRATVKDALEDCGYRVIEASNSAEAIGKINQKSHQPHVAILDIRLSDENDPFDHSGLKLWRNLPSDLPVIILTAHEDARVVRSAFQPALGQSEPKAYLFKRDGLEAILATIQNVISHANPSSQPWYKEPAFVVLAFLTVILVIGGGLYIEYISQGSQLLGIIVVGIIIEIVAGALLRYFKLGE